MGWDVASSYGDCAWPERPWTTVVPWTWMIDWLRPQIFRSSWWYGWLDYCWSWFAAGACNLKPETNIMLDPPVNAISRLEFCQWISPSWRILIRQTNCSPICYAATFGQRGNTFLKCSLAAMPRCTLDPAIVSKLKGMRVGQGTANFEFKLTTVQQQMPHQLLCKWYKWCPIQAMFVDFHVAQQGRLCASQKKVVGALLWDRNFTTAPVRRMTAESNVSMR